MRLNRLKFGCIPSMSNGAKSIIMVFAMKLNLFAEKVYVIAKLGNT